MNIMFYPNESEPGWNKLVRYVTEGLKARFGNEGWWSNVTLTMITCVCVDQSGKSVRCYASLVYEASELAHAMAVADSISNFGLDVEVPQPILHFVSAK